MHLNLEFVNLYILNYWMISLNLKIQALRLSFKPWAINGRRSTNHSLLSVVTCIPVISCFENAINLACLVFRWHLFANNFFPNQTDSTVPGLSPSLYTKLVTSSYLSIHGHLPNVYGIQADMFIAEDTFHP